MAEAGLYVLTKIIAASIGTLTSLPGGVGIPAGDLIPTGTQSTGGYEMRLVDGTGAAIGQMVSEAPLPVVIDELPGDFLNAVIAAEDKRFLEHPGVDPFGTASATIDTLQGRLRGGSGIAQQMAKNTLVGSDMSIGRKGTEAMLAVRAQTQLGQREVLRRYLQTAWFGRGVTGVVAAPEAWFGKGWDQIDLAEAVTLAAMLKGPARYDPWRNPGIVKERRDAILTTMADRGWISAADAQSAQETPVVAIPPGVGAVEDAWLASLVREELARTRDTMPDRGTATVTIDPRWQALAGKALSDAVLPLSGVREPLHLDKERLTEIRHELAALPPEESARIPRELELALPPGSPYRSSLLIAKSKAGWDVLTAWGLETGVKLSDPHKSWDPEVGDVVPALEAKEGAVEIRLPTLVEGAVVAIDPRTGAVLASIGGVDAGLTSFDRTRALRQPGSAIKPFLYLAALDMGFEPGSPVDDIEVTWMSNGESWRPKNYDLSQSGVMPMHTALERSSNLAAAWLADRIGIVAMAEVAEAAGVYPPGGMARVLPSALGATESTLSNLVSGYAAIVNDAIPRQRHGLSLVTGIDGTQVPARFSLGTGPVSTPGAATDLLGMMRGVVVRGTASQAFRNAPVTIAGKTGTTQEHRDAWFIGVTPHLVIGVWLGRDDNKSLPGKTAGGSDAAPIAATILKQAFDAGLIDADGYRDQMMSSGMLWPPALHDDLAAAATPPARRVVQETLYGREGSSTGTTFWGGIEDQRGQARQPVPEPRYDEQPMNRNGDLLDFEW